LKNRRKRSLVTFLERKTLVPLKQIAQEERRSSEKRWRTRKLDGPEQLLEGEGPARRHGGGNSPPENLIEAR